MPLLQKFDESALRTAISLFSIKPADWSRVLQEWIFAPTSAVRRPCLEIQRWPEFHCETASFWIELRSPLRYEPDVLELSKISARVAGGEMNGYFAMQPEAEDSPFTASVNFRDVLADQIVEHAGGPKGMVKGKLEGNFKASGKTGDADALIGKGEIFLREGRVEQYSLLVLLRPDSPDRRTQGASFGTSRGKISLEPGTGYYR